MHPRAKYQKMFGYMIEPTTGLNRFTRHSRIPELTGYRGMGGVEPNTDIQSLIGLIILLDNELLQYK